MIETFKTIGSYVLAMQFGAAVGVFVLLFLQGANLK